MGTTLNKKSYAKLIEENIAEMEKHMPEHSLEKKHAIDVLKWSINAMYEGEGLLVNPKPFQVPVKGVEDVKTAQELFLEKYGNKITGAESWVIRFAEEYALQFKSNIHFPSDEEIESKMPNSILDKKFFGAIWLRDFLRDQLKTSKVEN